MARGIRITYYLYEVKDRPIGEYARGIESGLDRFLRLVNPDEYTLLMNFREVLGSSEHAYVIELRDEVNRWFYLTKEVKDLEKPSAAYEYEVGKEKGLEVVFKEIAEGSAHKKWGVDKVSSVLQVILWGGFMLLGWLGYRNYEMAWMDNLLPLVLLLSGLIEGFRRGYKKKKKR